MSESTELRVVPFKGDEIHTFEREGGRYVVMRRIVENMGMAWSSQFVKLQEQKEKFSCYDIVTPDSRGHEQEMFVMPVEKLPLWLATINPAKIPSLTVREKVERYQAECAIVLHDYWTKGAAVRPDFDGTVVGMDPAMRAVFGGIMKSVVIKQLEMIVPDLINKSLETVLPEMVRAQLSQGRLAVRNGKTAGQIWHEFGLPPLKNAPQWLSHLLLKMGAAAENGARGELGKTSAKMFDHDKASTYMRNGGLQRCKRYIAERGGQGALDFGDLKKAA